MKLVRRRELSGVDLASQIRRRVREIDQESERLKQERRVLQRRLKNVKTPKPEPRKAGGHEAATCPRCGRTRDFLTDADGYLAHVLEEPGDTELLVEGKPLFCPECGEVFLWKPNRR